MKIDMHCHVKEGSPDSKISIDHYIQTLKSKGFDGMVVTDHDTYNGYRYWKEEIRNQKHTSFVVLKGIEYDTRDAGHILVIMPPQVKKRLLETRGLPVSVLIDFVHKNGGILGPAHPCGEAFMSITHTRFYRKHPDILKQFDFIEAFNACETLESNEQAAKLAAEYHLPGVGGSDAHNFKSCGMGYTILPERVTSEIELISLLRKKGAIEAGGSLYNETVKEKLGKASILYTYSFWVYNVTGTLMKRHKRKKKTQIENPIDPIDPIELTIDKRTFRTRLKHKF
ncbi:MAG: CehA/McbA family metallohydrolase [Ruminococcus sp.]|nr:CehA/McbA family metallohydrolase [Ruminococcus sp.]